MSNSNHTHIKTYLLNEKRVDKKTVQQRAELNKSLLINNNKYRH